WHLDAATVCAGLMHDVLEDTCRGPGEIAAASAEIAGKFGPEVLAIVQGESEDKPKGWKERKQATIDALPGAPLAVQQVCCADKLANARSILADGDAAFERFNAPREDIGWYYRSIAQALTKLEGSPMKAELEATIEAIGF
ncbi:MAG: HD domain-containing protein, partial [Duodenibacillus sp.]|nr:HD domain-containing protein [Duodenibacillus sp.]